MTHRSLCLSLLALAVMPLGAGCEAIASFDRDKIDPMTAPPAVIPRPDGGALRDAATDADTEEPELDAGGPDDGDAEVDDASSPQDGSLDADLVDGGLEDAEAEDAGRGDAELGDAGAEDDADDAETDGSSEDSTDAS